MYLDAMRYAAEMVELSYARLCDELLAIVHEDDEGRHRRLSIEALHDAWAIIDSADRLRSLICTAKFFHDEDRKAFGDNMRSVRELRNTVQHLSGKIANLASQQWPVWGSLSWFEWTEPPHKGRTCLLAAGSRVTRRAEVAQEPREGDYVPGLSEVTLTSGGIEVSLRTVRENVIQFAAALEQGVKDEHANEPAKRFVADVFVSVDVDFRRKV